MIQRPHNRSVIAAASREAAVSRRSRRAEILILTARVNFNP